MIALRTSLSSAALVALLSFAPVVRGEPDAAQVVEARKAFEKGAQLAAETRWSDALAQFEHSASLKPHAVTTYNIGFCERALGRSTRARKAFRLALAQDDGAGKSQLGPELRSAAIKYEAEMQQKVATPKITVAPPDARISVDGRPLEASSDGRYVAGTRPTGPGEKVASATFVLEVDAGSHEILLVAPDGRSTVVHETFGEGSTRAIRVELPPAPPPLPIVRDTSSARRTWGFVLGGVGLAAVGVGTYFGFQARSTWAQAKEACPARTQCPDDRGADLSAEARVQANISTIGFVAGGVAVLSGTLLLLTSSAPERPRVNAVALPGGGFVGLSMRF